MITDKQIEAVIRVYHGNMAIPDRAMPLLIQDMRKALEAYERSKLVTDKSIPPKAGERIDGNWYSQYVYDPDNDAVIYYDSESDQYHRPNGQRSRDPSRYYLLPEFKE